MGEAASAFVHWLGGALDDGLENADENLSKLIDVLQSRGEAAHIAAGIGDDFAQFLARYMLLSRTEEKGELK